MKLKNIKERSVRHRLFAHWGKGKVLSEVGGKDRPAKILVHFQSYPQGAAIWIPKEDVYEEVSFGKFLKSFAKFLKKRKR